MPTEREPNRYEALRQPEQAQPAAPADRQTAPAKEEAQPEQQASTWQDRFEAAQAADEQKLADMRAGGRHSNREIAHTEVQMDNDREMKLRSGGFDRDPTESAGGQKEAEGDKEQTDAKMAKAQRLAEAAQARQEQQAEQSKEKEAAVIDR